MATPTIDCLCILHMWMVAPTCFIYAVWCVGDFKKTLHKACITQCKHRCKFASALLCGLIKSCEQKQHVARWL